MGSLKDRASALGAVKARERRKAIMARASTQSQTFWDAEYDRIPEIDRRLLARRRADWFSAGLSELLQIAQFQQRGLYRQALSLHHAAHIGRQIGGEGVFEMTQRVLLALLAGGQKRSIVPGPNAGVQFAPSAVLDAAEMAGIGRRAVDLADACRQLFRKSGTLPGDAQEPVPQVFAMNAFGSLAEPLLAVAAGGDQVV